MSKFSKGVKRTNTDCLKWDARMIRFNSNDAIPFWVADSDYETCPEVKKEIIKRAKNGAFGYVYINDEYYDILSNWCFNRYGYKITKDNVVITPGIVNALYFLVNTFTNASDNILVNTPVYNPFFEVIETNKRGILYNKMQRIDIDNNMFTYQFDFLDLEEKLKNSKMYILCNPHNPIGRCYTIEELSKIVELCKKYNVILVSDEIHCDLIMTDGKFNSVGKLFNEYENIVLCTAPSKTFNIAGLANSNIIFNNLEMQKVFKDRYHDMELDANVFGELACKIAYSKGEKWVEEERIYLTKSRNIVYDFCKENNLPVCKLEGTYLMWIDMTKLGLSQDEIYNGLLMNKVLVNRGSMYSSDCSGYIRFNIACGEKQLREGLKLIKQFLDTFK